MNIPIDTLAFAEKFENAGFAHDQARALAAAFGRAGEAGREGLVTKDHLDAQFAELKAEIGKQIADLRVELGRDLAQVGKDVQGRLWSITAIVAGVSTAVSTTVAAATALLLR